MPVVVSAAVGARLLPLCFNLSSLVGYGWTVMLPSLSRTYRYRRLAIKWQHDTRAVASSVVTGPRVEK